MNHKGEYDFEYSDIGLYQEESTPMDRVITENGVSDGMNFNTAKSELGVTKRGKIITQIMVQNANEMNKKDKVVSLKSDSGEKIDDERVFLTQELSCHSICYI
jgi:hypothetical protein